MVWVMGRQEGTFRVRSLASVVAIAFQRRRLAFSVTLAAFASVLASAVSATAFIRSTNLANSCVWQAGCVTAGRAGSRTKAPGVRSAQSAIS